VGIGIESPEDGSIINEINEWGFVDRVFPFARAKLALD